MTTTKIADIITPDVFVPYVIEEIPKHSMLVASGIIVPDEALNTLAQKGGKYIDMPFFTDLTGDDELLSDQNALTPGKIGTGQDVAALLMRGRAWGVNDLAKALSGADPMAAIGSLVARYWAKREQATLIASLNGVFASNADNNAGDLVNDISIDAGDAATDANLIGGSAVIDTEQLLGDNAGVFEAIAMHSVPFGRLKKLQLIDWVPEIGGKIEAGMKNPNAKAVPVFNGLRVIVDDACPVADAAMSGKLYTTYLFAGGAVGRGEGSAPEPVETDRDRLAGEDYLINRRHFLLHPRGFRFAAGSVAGQSPSNTELALAANWLRVYDKKVIRVAKLVTNG